MPAQRKRSRQAKEDDPDVKLDMLPKVMYEFVDETKKLYGQRGTGTTTPPSISSETLTSSKHLCYRRNFECHREGK